MPGLGADILGVHARLRDRTRRRVRVHRQLTVATLGIWLLTSLSSAVVLILVRDSAPAAAQTTLPGGGTSTTRPTGPATNGPATTAPAATRPTSPATTVATNSTTTADRRPLEVVLDRNAALFEVADLVPGSVGVNCVTARLVDGGDVDVVRLFGEVGGSGLADHLDVVLEVGTVAPGAACSTFTGSVAFTGTLADFGRQHRDAATGAALPVVDGRTTIRMTWTLRDDNEAQGRTAAAAFVFEARGVGVAVEQPTPTTVPGSTATTTAPRDQTPVGEQSDATESRVQMIARNLTGWLPEGIQPAVRRGIEVAVLTTELAARTTAFPSAFIVALGVFVVLQHRIDRADPKLARAPSHPEPDLRFLPRHTIGRAR